SAIRARAAMAVAGTAAAWAPGTAAGTAAAMGAPNAIRAALPDWRGFGRRAQRARDDSARGARLASAHGGYGDQGEHHVHLVGVSNAGRATLHGGAVLAERQGQGGASWITCSCRGSCAAHSARPATIARAS